MKIRKIKSKYTFHPYFHSEGSNNCVKKVTLNVNLKQNETITSAYGIRKSDFILVNMYALSVM